MVNNTYYQQNLHFKRGNGYMFAYLTRLQRNRKGFTLIELMVVVVILGILAGAAIMTLGGGQSCLLYTSRCV